MSHNEINNILKSSYGEDLGYDSDDDDYEYYSKLKSNKLVNEKNSPGPGKSVEQHNFGRMF